MRTDAPIVSVVMPTRNRAALLPRAIGSVLAQTHAGLELIVVDDASTDDTRRLLADISARDSRVRAIHLAARAGGAAARNCGIAAATTAWVAFIDDDDEWLATKLERQLQRAREAGEETGLVYCTASFMDADEREFILQSEDIDAREARPALLRRNFISTPTVLARRDALASVGGFDEALPRLQDWDLWIRLAAVTRFACVPHPLVRAFHTEGGISTSSEALLEACRLLDRKYRTADFAPAEWADFQHALGHILMIGGAPAAAPPYLWRSARSRPSVRRFIMAGLARLGPGVYRAVSRAHERVVRFRAARAAVSGT